MNHTIETSTFHHCRKRQSRHYTFYFQRQWLYLSLLFCLILSNHDSSNISNRFNFIGIIEVSAFLQSTCSYSYAYRKDITHYARIPRQQQQQSLHVQYRYRGRGNENQHYIPSYLRDRVSVSPLASYTTDTVEDTITTTSTTQTQTHSSPQIACQTEDSSHEESQEQQQNQQHDQQNDENEDEEMEGARKRSTNRHSSSSSSTSNSNSSETTNNQQPTHEEMMEQRRQDALKAIRLKKYGKTRTSSSTSKTTQKNRKNTSVGPRRVGSASRARSARSGSGSSIGKLLGGFQSAAAAAASKKLKGNNGKKSNKEGGDTTKDKDAPSNLWSGTILLDPRAIRATISDIMGTQQREKFNIPKETSSSSGEKEEITLPDYMKANLSIRLATPQDDTNIANLRLSVFSDFTPDQRRMFCEKSKEVLGYRRTKGATCIVAFLPHLQRSEKRDYEGLNLIRPEVNHVKNRDNDGAAVAQYEHSPTMQYTSFLNNLNEQNENLHGGILGSAECSTHEFVNTELGRQRPSGSIVYITEFAVSPMARRAGIGTKLLQGIELLARHRGVETLYLHVDVTNDAAIEMYTKQGFKELDSRENPLYAEFTTKLNLHDGANTVRKNKHHLLAKDLTDRPTWLNGRGTLGFDIPQ